MKPSLFKLLVPCLALTFVMACGFTVSITPNAADPGAYNTAIAQTANARGVDPNVFATSVALTAVAASPLSLPGGNTSIPPSAIPPTQALSDEQAIQNALAAQLGWNQAEMQFNLSASDGHFAHGFVENKNQPGGAAWYAAKDSSGNWLILHVGQSWPPCAAIQPYNFPVSYVAMCEDASGQIVDRASGQLPPPPNPTVGAPTQTDIFAPDPLGPAWTGFWFAPGACYDLDGMTPVSSAGCDIFLDENNLLVPQNGAVFEASLYQYAPSLNTCKSAALDSTSIDGPNAVYICFKTNANKYGFMILRDVNPAGIVFDAYVFP